MLQDGGVVEVKRLFGACSEPGTSLADCSVLVIKFPDFNKLRVNFGNQTLIDSARMSGGHASDTVSERAPIITDTECFSRYCWTLILRLLKATGLRTVDAFCRQCVRGAAFYGAPSRTCLEGCCCKSCAIYKKNKKTKQVFLSARFRLHKPQRHTNRLWPAAIPPWNFFLYQTAPLSTLNNITPPLPPLQPLHWADGVVFFALRLSLTVLHGKYLAADACGRPLPGHVGLPLSSVSTATQRENGRIHGDKEVCSGLVP